MSLKYGKMLVGAHIVFDTRLEQLIFLLAFTAMKNARLTTLLAQLLRYLCTPLHY